MVTAQTGHPPVEKLVAFGQGRLDDVESAAIEVHLATCVACLQVVEDTPIDSLVETLREPAPAPAAEKPDESRPGLFTRLAGIVNPQEAKPESRPVARPHLDVPAELRDHPRYEILEWLGAGGMGTVFKTRHRLMDRVVALKVMNPRLLAELVAVVRFQREVKAAAQLAHPHIVTAYDAEQVGTLHFLAMEFVEGQTLADVVDRHGPLPVHQACDYVRQAALGLQFAHEHGMVHRDIKPQNLVLTETGQVKVFDFGLARFVSESGEPGAESGVGKLLGSPDYMAPEQAGDAHRADIRADIYSLGCTLYHLLAGLPPFPGGNMVEKVAAHVGKAPLAVTQIRQDIPPGLPAVLDRMLAKEPAQRFQTPGGLAAALEPFCQTPSVTPTKVDRPASDFVRRHARWLTIAAVLLAVLGLGGALFAPAIYRIATNQGVLIIETDDRDVEVVVKQAGEQVTILDTKTRREVQLKAGEYQLELADGKDGLRLSTTEFRLTRGSRQIARVWLERRESPPAAEHRSPDVPEAPLVVPPTVEILELRTLVGHRSHVVSVAFSRDGRYVLSGSTDKTVRLWDVAGGKEVRRYAGFAAAVRSIAFSPDEALVAAAGDDGVIHVWATGINEVTRSVSEATRQPAGSSLTLRVTVGKPISSGDFDSAPQVRQFQGHSQGVTSVAFSPDGRRLVSGSGDTTVRLWDVGSGRHIKTFSGHQGEVRCVAFSPDGRQVVSGGRDKTVRLWDVETGQQLRLFDRHTQPVNAVVFAPGGGELFSGAVDRTIRRWDLKTGVVTGALFPREWAGKAGGDSDAAPRTPPANSSEHPSGVWPLALSRDGRWALSGSGWDANLGLAGSDYRVRLYHVASGWEIGRFEGHTSPLQSVAFSPDGRLAASGGWDKTVRILWLGEPARPATQRPASNVGQLALAENSPSLPVMVKRDGRLVTVLHLKASSNAQLEPGEYELELAGQPEEFELSADKVSVKAGEKKSLAIHRLPLADMPPVAAISEVRRFEGHMYYVERAVFSPDGRQIVTCSRDKTVRVWEVAGGGQTGRFTGHSEYVFGLALSPDGRLAVSAGGGDHKDGKFVATDFKIRLWDVAAGKEVRTFAGHTHWISSLAISPDGRYVLSGSVDQTIRLWDVNTGGELRRFQGHEGAVNHVAFSPDARRILSGGTDGLVRLWDVDTGQELRRFDGHTDFVAGVGFSPDGRLVLSGSFDKTMRVWDAETGQQLRCVTHPSRVSGVAFSPDGRRVLSASGDRIGNGVIDCCVRLWDVASGRELGRFEGHTDAVIGVAFSPDGRQALSNGWDNSVRLLKLPDPPSLPITEVRNFTGHKANVNQAVFSPDGSLALSSSDDLTLRLWNVRSGEEVRQFESTDAIAHGLAFSPDGRLALSSTWGQLKDGKWTGDCSVRMWDVTTGKEVRRFPGHTASDWDVTFTPDGRRILSASWDTTLRLWDVETGRQMRVFQGHTDGIGCMVLSADGRLALSGSADKTVRLWDVATGRELRRLEGHVDVVWGVAVSADGRQALSCGADRTIRLWDLTTGRQVRLFCGHQGTVWWIALSPDGKRVVSGSQDSTVRLWDVATGQELGRFAGFGPASAGQAFGGTLSPDGQYALAGGADATLRLLKLPAADDHPKLLSFGDTSQLVLDSEATDGWLLVKQRKKVVLVLDATATQTAEVKPGEYQLELAGRTGGLRLSADKFTLSKGARQVVQVRRESKPARVEITEFRRLSGHRNGIQRAVIAPDGRHVLSGGADGTLRLWDVLTGQETRCFQVHAEEILGVAFSPDGRLVAAGGRGVLKDSQSQAPDFSIMVWDAATAKSVHRFEGHTAEVWSVTFSPDGRCLASGSWDGTVRIWDLAAKRQLHVLKGHSQVNDVAFSPDGRFVLSGGWADKTVRLWDVHEGKEVRTFEGHGAPVWSVAFSPDGTLALSASSDRTVRLWDVKSGRVTYAFPPGATGIKSATFSPDGRRIVTVSGTRWAAGDVAMSAGTDYRVRLWDVASREEIGSFDCPGGEPLRAAWSRDGRFAVCSALDKVVRLLWFSESGAGERPTDGAVKSQPAIETNGFDLPVIVKQPDKLVTVIVPKISKLADLPPGEYELELAGQPEDFRLSADKVTLAKGEKQTISILEVPSEKPPYEITEVRRFEGHTAVIESVAFSPDGRWVLSGSQDKTVRLWEVGTGKAVRQFEGNTQSVFSVAFSPDGRQALSAGLDAAKRDFAIRLWDVDTGKETRRFTGHTDHVWIAVFSPDGSRVLSGSGDRTVRLWDVKTGTELRQFTGHENAVRCVAFAPDGRRVASASYDGTVRLWEVETGKELRCLEGHTEAANWVAFSPDGRQAVSCGFDRTVRLWNLETGRPIRAFSRHPTCPFAVTFSPDGRRILSNSGWRPVNGDAGFDYCVRLWDVATGAELGRFEGHKARPLTVVFSPDGRAALSAGYDNIIRLLQLPEPGESRGTPSQEKK